MTSRNDLKRYFLTNLKPTQGQFAELIDSLFHKGEDTVSISMIAGLGDVLAGKASDEQINALANQISEVNAVANGAAKSITDIAKLIGDLSLLNTSTKNNLVAAINEVLANAGGLKPGDVGVGLTINADKKLTLDLVTKQLVSPAISVQWSLFCNDGVTPYSPATSSAKALIVDKGVKASMAAKYKYPANTDSQALPQSAASATFSTMLPGADTFSDTLAVNNIAANRSDTITLQKPKSGLVVANGQVAFPTGNDTAADSISITFRGRGFYLYSSKAALTAADVQALYNAAAYQQSRGITLTGITPGVGNYLYYIYDADLTAFTAVLYNDAEAYFGAFQFQAGGLTVVNNAGINQNLIVARSNATNAFNNAKLAFS